MCQAGDCRAAATYFHVTMRWFQCATHAVDLAGQVALREHERRRDVTIIVYARTNGDANACAFLAGFEPHRVSEYVPIPYVLVENWTGARP